MFQERQITVRAALLLMLLPACSIEGSAPARSISTTQGVDGLRNEAMSRRLSAAFLIVDGVYNTELTAPYDVLEHTVYHAPEDLGIDVFTVSPDGSVVTTAEGLRILPDHGFDNAPPVDILVVPSAEGSRDSDLNDRALVEWVATVGREASVVMSLCWGAFVLAEAGLLDDRECTTFPADFATFAQRFPESSLRVNVSFVHDGDAITSQGGARSFDAAMYLVDLLYGGHVAERIGNGLLIAWPPPDRAGVVPYIAPTRAP